MRRQKGTYIELPGNEKTVLRAVFFVRKIVRTVPGEGRENRRTLSTWFVYPILENKGIE